jgi:hypothetical protein
MAAPVVSVDVVVIPAPVYGKSATIAERLSEGRERVDR